MVPAEMVCVPAAAAKEIPIVCVPSEPARMTAPFETLPPTASVLHAAPSTFADIARPPVLVGPVDPLPLLPPHAVEITSADVSIIKHLRIDCSWRGFERGPTYIAPSPPENRR